MASDPDRFRVRVTKDHLVFSAAHFITFNGNVCERLHGHNWRVAVEVTGGLDEQWPRRRYAAMSLLADWMDVPGATHWGLVLNRRALAGLVPSVTAWLERVAR